MGGRIVPIFRSGDPAADLAFWTALGFEILHDQRRPYIYLSVRRGDLQVDFSGQVPAATALFLVDDADALNAAFRAGIKAATGRVPRTGTPRIGLVSQQKSDRRFNMTDPSGNHVIAITPGAQEERLDRSPLAQAVAAARLSAYGKEDLAWAAAHLDRALAAGTAEPAATQLAAWVLRADVAALSDDAAGLRHALAMAERARGPDAAPQDLARLDALAAGADRQENP